LALTNEQREGYARQLMANPLVDELIDEMVANALAKWRGAAPSDDHARFEAWHEDKAARTFKTKFTNLALTSEIET